jgi:inward rectifier potassium channel
LFSRVAVIANYDGTPALMFRAANQRSNQIVEARLWVTVARDEVTKEGLPMRRIYDLKLLRSHSPFFALTWTAIHPIDEISPFYGETPESLLESDTEVLVTLTGTDETVAQPIHARHSYFVREILWNVRFVDIFSRTPDGERVIDYRHFHDVTLL